MDAAGNLTPAVTLNREEALLIGRLLGDQTFVDINDLRIAAGLIERIYDFVRGPAGVWKN